MNYDSFCMAAIADELRAGVLDAFVDQVYQPDPLVVVLAITGRGPRRFWLFSSDARWPRAHATTLRRPNPDTPPAFCMLLRKHLNGSRLAEVEQVRFDRVLRLTFRRGEETRTVVHEVMGRHSNLMLLDEAGLILGAVKMVPPAKTRVRPVLPGLPYQEPPGVRPDPRTLTPAEIRALVGTPQTPEEITRALSGWGTFAAREALLEGPEHAAARVAERMAQVRRGDYAPVVLLEADGRPKGVWAFPSAQVGWTHGEPERSVSAACDRFYGYLEANSETEALRKTVLGGLERGLKTARLQLTEAEAHLEGIGKAELLRIKGELLSSQGSRIERGTEAVELPNWYDPEGGLLRIELDPELDARENAERFFHRYRRATAAAEAALERIPELTAQVEALTAQVEEARVAAGERLQTLLQAAREAAPHLLAGGGEPGGKGKAAESEFPPGVRIKRVPLGAWEIYYGENATSNDYLTTRWARPADLWLHARAVAGSHVIIRGVISLERLPAEVLREAARLAAAHSEAKHAAIVPVDYTFRRYVRKPRGSAPGRVTYSGEKTLHVDLK